ncbi:calcium-binding protein [Tessaracoccus sp. ZS01]|uniref:calcium-binding protein n=1 Tax=Tessaracoccus sp. ZS01 TaxID=1906324 RepID=UPI0009FB0C80|nr:calcium-binding protein [Tessaracoccus sp. ZS01]MCG6568057.1 calcium-binding protein [Tessaracoccus sp. ZS01]
MIAIAVLLSGFFAASLNRAWAAPDDGVADIKGFLSTNPTGNLATWSKDLGTVGALALPLPLVTSSPGALLGVDDIIQKVVVDTLSGVVSFNELIAAPGTGSFPFTLPDGRSGTLTTNATKIGEGWRVDFTATVNRTVTGLDLHLADAATGVDLSVTGGVSAAVTAQVKFSIQEDGSGGVWMIHDTDPTTQSPRLDIDVTATVTANAKAAVGILGVSLTGSTLSVKHYTKATFNDPNNDGKLAFVGNQAELAAAGSLEGLVQADLDVDSNSSISGQFTLGADTTVTIPGFPTTVNATVAVNWPDITQGAPQVTATGFDATLGKFQNMNLQNLADGLARVITAINAIQQRNYDSGGVPTGNLDLPFMRGTLADVIAIAEPLKAFLADNVWSDGDPARLGTPKFSSLQDLLTKLNASLDLGTVSWDSTNNKFVIPLEFSGTASGNLDKAAQDLSGTSSTFTDTTMTVSGTPWAGQDLSGRRVVAGSSGGEIASNTDNSITLTGNWAPSTPTGTVNWVISGPEERTGAITFADVLTNDDGAGILGANAEASAAVVSATHKATITVVLDLNDPVTGIGCAPADKAGQPCPYETTIAGMKMKVDEWPLPTDRVMLRTGSTIYTADFPIESTIDMQARAGFFKVNIKGDLVMCRSSQNDTCSDTGTDPMVSMALKPIGDAQKDIRLSKLVSMLVTDPGAVLTPDINIRAKATASITVPELEGFIGNDVTFTLNWTDLTDPDTLAFTAPNFSKLTSLDFSVDNPKALFNMVIKQLQTLVHNIAEADPGTGSDAYNTKLPGIGRSLRDLVLSDQANGDAGVSYGTKTLVDSTRTAAAAKFTQAMVGRAITVGTQVNIVESVSTDGTTLTMVKDWDALPVAGTRYTARAALLDAVDWLVANNPDTIQDLVTNLNSRLGGTPLSVAYVPGTAPAPASLVLKVAWDRSYRTDTPIAVDLGALGDVVTVKGTGQAQASVTGSVNVGILVPLSTADPGFKVMEDSSISVHANASGEGVLTGTLGPLSLSLGDPSGAEGAEKAKVAVDLGVRIGVDGATANNPVDWSTFLSSAGVKLNPTGMATGGVTCESGITTELMACANVPLFAKGVSDYTSVGALKVRLPRSSDLGDLLPSGNLPAPDDALKQLDIPADLAARIAAAVLDFGQFEHGLDSYLATAEVALRAASFEGKLPLVGKDLQQGADFLGTLRTTLKNEVLGGLTSFSPKDWVAEVNKRLDEKLTAAGLQAVSPLVGLECKAFLEPATGLTAVAVPVPAADAVKQTYEYRVVAYQGPADAKEDTVASSVASVEQAALSASVGVKLDWTAVAGATGYKVLRKLSTDAEFMFLFDVGSALTYTDNGTATAAAYTLVVEKPQLIDCPANQVGGVTLEVTVRDEFTGASRPLDIGIPGLSLKADPASGQSTVSVGAKFALHLKVGLNLNDGFYVATQDGWDTVDGNAVASPELGVELTVTMPAKVEAKLAFIGVDITSAGAPEVFTGHFKVDLHKPGQTGSCFAAGDALCAPSDSAKLTFADLSTASMGDLFAVSIGAAVTIDWDIESRIEIDGDDSLLPGVKVNFELGWTISADNDGGSLRSSVGTPTIAFNDFQIDAGKVFSDILGPILEKVKSVTGPIQPIIDALYAPLPVLSDVSKAAGGGDISLFTLAETFSTLADGPDLTMVKRITNVITLLNSLPECTTSCWVTIGSFKVLGDDALDTTLTPDVAGSLITGGVPNATLLSDLNGKAGPSAPKTFTEPGGSATAGKANEAGITFPIFQEPTKAFALLMGGDIDIVKFDSGNLTLGFAFSQEFGPVYAPPPVLLTLSGSASITARIRAGMDTYGIRKAIEMRDTASAGEIAVSVLDGLYFDTNDENGKPLPVVTLKGEIAAGAMVSVLVVSVGVEGGLGLTVGLYWNDPNNDGKFRLTEFVQALVVNPLCLFQMSGRVYLFLQLTIKIGVSIFSVSFSVRLVELTLLDFTVKVDCSPPPPNVGGVVGDTLYVFTGKLGTDSYRGAPWGAKADGDAEVIKVTQLHYAQTTANIDGTDGAYDGIKVQMLGITREFHDPGIKRVVVDGTSSPVPMKLTFSGDGQRQTEVTPEGAPPPATTAFDREVVVKGTGSADQITAGNGPAYIDGAGGDDVITTVDTGLTVNGLVSKAWVAGGTGADNITVGDGDNKVAGDATLAFTQNTSALTTVKAVDAESDPPDIPAGAVIAYASAKDPTTQAQGDNWAGDTIRVGLGATKVRGNAGDDTISVTTNTPTLSSKGSRLIGDDGNDRLNGGAGNDVIFTGAELDYGVDDVGSDDADVTTFNIVNSGEGNDFVWGSKGVDYLTSGSLSNQSTQLVGGDANDVLVGGLGTDKLYGGPGDDYLSAEPAVVGDPAVDPHTIDGVTYGPLRTVTALALPPGATPNTKTLVGGLGNDHVFGGDGAALIYGDTFNQAEQCKAGATVASDPVTESTTAATGDGNDFIIGGKGVDTVSAGGGDDRVQAGGGNDLVCGQHGSDKLDGQGGDDQLWGGAGVDSVWGGDGEDDVFGNADNDFLYGGNGADVIEGNAGDDWASGGHGNDLVVGGTRAAGKPDGADQLYGDQDLDRLIGDNATAAALSVPVDLATTVQPSTLGGKDTIWGGDDNDTAFGGLDDDTVYGQGGEDHLEGNNGADTVLGGAGHDMIVGGSWEEASAGIGRPDAGDRLFGEEGDDLIAGDNAIISVVSLAQTHQILRNRITDGRSIVPLDLGDAPTAGTSGADEVYGGDGTDVILGQGGHDRLIGHAGADLIEGWAGTDWIEGNDGDDDLIGGSSWALSGTGNTTVGQPDVADAIFGGDGDDALLGDNGRITRPSTGEASIAALKRMGSDGGSLVTARWVEWFDLAAGGAATRYGDDRLSGGDGVDGIWGQDGADVISGDGDGDYVEGNGGADTIRGDLPIGVESAKTPGATVLADPGWPGSASAAAQLMGPGAPDGQDDIIGGSSRRAFRDTGDIIEANGADDVVVGDNGTLLRKLQGMPGEFVEAVFTERYPIGAVPSSATAVRVSDPASGEPTTRFCSASGTTCEPVGAFGDDVIYGDDGDDGLWGQDGDDTIRGGNGNDEVYGELGSDELFGEAGDDAILGDRGGVVTTYLDGDRGPAEFTVTLNQPPAETFTGFRRGALDRRIDLLHDTNGGVWLGSSTTNVMPHPGTVEGGRDRIRGGLGSDVIDAGADDDLVNGDSGGDRIFGGNGEDVLWGGRGCDPLADAATTDCLSNGAFDASSRGDNDRFVDFVFGGAGELDTAKQDVIGSDIIDWAPRGGFASCTTSDWPVDLGAQVVDPCAWFEMTDTADADAVNDQHHQGVDWLYGGLDRDVLQGDVTANGPNAGDRLMDTTGAFNLYSHCNAAYGGFNDLRVMSPAVRDFVHQLAWTAGAGQTVGDVTTKGTSAFTETAMVYNTDMKRAAGPAYPNTPGHFDMPACQP